MAKEHYNAVRESDLYEYGGTRKVLLTYIAGLIIGPPEENAQGKPVGEPDKDEGYCVARQEVLAAWIGCSREEACRQIDEFVHDGWLTKEKFTDTYGHERCKYTITPAQMKKILACKMKIEEKNGIKHPIRAKHPGKKGNDKSLLNLVRPGSGKRSHHKKVEPPCDNSSQSPVMTGHKAHCGVITKPCDDTSIPVVESVVPSFVANSSHKEDQPQKQTPSTSSYQGKNENQSQPREPQDNISPAGRKKTAKGSAPRAKRPAPRAAFKPEVEEKFRMAGAPDIWFEAMAPLTDTVDVLNGENVCGCPYPLQSWATIANKNPLLKAAQLWTPVFKNGQLEYSDGWSLADQIMSKRMEALKTPEDREKSAAMFWWGSLELKRMHELVADELWVGDSFGRGAPDSAILAAYREHAPKRKPQPIPAKKTPVDQLSYVDLDGVDPEFA
jgi:hypothetical protein